MKGGIPNPSSQPKFGPNPIPSGCLPANEQSFSSNSCWHNYIKNTSLNLTFNIFIRLTHYLYFAASVVCTVQSKSVKDYSLQFFVRITALFAELKHFDDHNCAKCGKHF